MGSPAICLDSARVALVNQALERDFEALLQESSTLAFRVAFAVLRHRQDSEDVAQEAFVRAYRRFHQLRDRDRFRAWLVRMTWRLAIDRKRSDQRRHAREQSPSAAAPSVAEIVIERDRADRLWRAIDRLPPKLRIVIVLASIEGHDIEATARLLKLPHGTVKSRLFLARAKLRTLLLCRTNS